jgi:hypothetical protein
MPFTVGSSMDGNMGMGTRYPSGIRPDGYGYGDDFYPWVVSVSDPNRDGYGTDIFFHPWVIRRVPDTLLPL